MAFRKARESKIGGKFLAYGYEGSGKSWFALTFPSVACIDSETGIAHYEGKTITLDNGNSYNNLILVDDTSDLDDLEEDIDEIMESDEIETLDIASKYKRVCCSDEFFLLAEREIPPASYYGNFSQLEDGVGSIRLLLEDFKSLKLPKSISQSKKIIFATSFAAKYALEKICAKLNNIKNLTTEVVPVKSNYWGQDITVAGLITTEDLINSLKDKKGDFVVIPSVMLRPYSEDFLDGKTLSYVKEKTGKEFFVINNIYSMKELVDYLSAL